MSIFKSTFPPYVARQLEARQHLLQDGDNSTTRTRNVQFYTAGKSSWIRMASLVNYDGRGYVGDQLARKYILQAGTLYNDPSNPNSFGLRSGVGGARGSYASTSIGGERPLGIRPMPGIVSIDVVNKSAYGSLRQATIKFKAWDKPQLDDLEILFMRTGFWVTLEWGWSKYIDTSVNNGEDFKTEPDARSIKVSKADLDRFIQKPMQSFTDPTIDPFDTKLSLENIYNNIAYYRHKFSGNYDGLLGMVENFTWELMPDGSYDCTTILISIGDVLETLKMNRPKTGTEAQTKTVKTGFSDTMDSFLNMDINEFVSTKLDNKQPIPGLNTNTNIDLNNKYIINSNSVIPKPSAGSNTINNSDKHAYIQFAYLIYIINIKYNLYDEEGNKYLNIQVPLPTADDKNRGICLASSDSISINPLDVLIYNDKATFITGMESGYNPNTLFLSCDTTMKSFLVEDEPQGHTLGYIGNAYVSVSRIKDIFEDLISSEKSSGTGVVGIRPFLDAILHDISYALGSINDFGIFVDDNVVTIIDKNYCERAKDSASDNKFKLNIIGNNTLTRSFKIFSKIFQSQATEVAIAAQGRTNLGGIYTATQAQFNKGLTPRIYKNLQTQEESLKGDKVQVGSTNQIKDVAAQREADKQAELKQLHDKLLDIAKNVLDLRDSIHSFLGEGVTPIFPEKSNISTYNTYLKTLLLEINTDANFRAIIPISLETTLDGIGGIVQGQIFTVNTDSLPQEYTKSKLGFIVTALSQHLKSSDWVTTIGGKVVLLDQKSLGGKNVVKDGLLGSLGEVRGTELANANAYVLAYLKIMCLIKLYYEDQLNVTGTYTTKLNKDSTSGGNTFNKINNLKIVSSLDTTVFSSKTGHSLVVRDIYEEVHQAGMYLNYQNGGLNLTKIADFLNSSDSSTESTTYYKGTRIVNVSSNDFDSEVTKATGGLRLLGKYSEDDKGLILRIVTYLPDYQNIPEETGLQNKILKNINTLYSIGGITITGIKPVQSETGRAIQYIEDASVGQLIIGRNNKQIAMLQALELDVQSIFR